jgi:hypothetical protein
MTEISARRSLGVNLKTCAFSSDESIDGSCTQRDLPLSMSDLALYDQIDARVTEKVGTAHPTGCYHHAES